MRIKTDVEKMFEDLRQNATASDDAAALLVVAQCILSLKEPVPHKEGGKTNGKSSKEKSKEN